MAESRYRIPDHYRAHPRETKLAEEADKAGWDPAIGNALARGYRFQPLAYDGVGYLFRGACSGIGSILQGSRLGYCESDGYHGDLERELGVYLVSQDPSDALSEAKLWQGGDGYIAVFSSALFNRELKAGRAGIMAFAEGGLVFRYPFLTRPLSVADLSLLVVPAPITDGPDAVTGDEHTLSNDGLGRIQAPLSGHDRTALSRTLDELLSEHGLEPAQPVPCRYVPGM